MISRLAVLMLAALWLAAAPARAEDASPCGGTDLIAKLAKDDPVKYAAFLKDAQAVPNAEGLLWRVEAPGRPPSYLFGTMHTTEADLVALSDPLKAAIAEANTVAVELADANGATAQADMIAYITANGVDLSGAALQGFDASQVEEIKRRLVAAGMPVSVATVLKPWFLAMTLQVSSCELKQMSLGKPTIDATIEKAGRDKGAAIVGLETVREQLDAVSKISEDTARRMIRDAVSKPETGDDLQETTIGLYRARRVGWYFAMKADAFGPEMDVSSYADFLSGVIDGRNALMAERAKPLFDKGGALVAVGALHLPGAKGLVELIRAQGFTVTKVW